MGGNAGITASVLPVPVLSLSQPGKGHWMSLESNVAARKRGIRAISPSCPPRERFHPASALRMSGQEDELPQRINYCCYLQMDQASE